MPPKAKPVPKEAKPIIILRNESEPPHVGHNELIYQDKRPMLRQESVNMHSLVKNARQVNYHNEPKPGLKLNERVIYPNRY